MNARRDLGRAADRLWDVVVIGAGPAGSLAAQQIAARGLRVLLADRAAFPRDKVCGGCLNQRALAALDRAGLAGLARDAGARPLHAFRAACGNATATVLLPGGAAISRARFDQALMHAAESAGATFFDACTARPQQRTDRGWRIALQSRAEAVEVETRTCIVATGLNRESLRPFPGVRVQRRRNARIGAGALLETGHDLYEPGTIYMAVAQGGYAGLVRVEGGRLNVAAALDPGFVREAGGPGPATAAVLRAANFPVPESLEAGVWRGTPPLTRRVQPRAGDRFLIVGDAAGYVEPFTGEGMAWAFDTAIAAARLVEEHVDAWTPETATAWERQQAACVGRSQRRCRVIAAGLRHPVLVGPVLRGVHAAPALAGPIVRALNLEGTREEPVV